MGAATPTQLEHWHLNLPPQGPLPGTVADFWQMVWQEKTSVIVMLTGLVEQNKVEKPSLPVLILNLLACFALLQVQLSRTAESSATPLLACNAPS